MTFAEKMRELRDKKEITEAALAEMCGMKYAAFHEYAIGRRVPAFPTIVKIATALGVDCRAFADCEFPHVEQGKKPKQR